MATVHPARGIQAYENLDHSRHTVGERERKWLELLTPYIQKVYRRETGNDYLPWLERHMTPTEQRPQANKISLRLKSVFLPTKSLKIHTYPGSRLAMDVLEQNHLKKKEKIIIIINV